MPRGCALAGCHSSIANCPGELGVFHGILSPWSQLLWSGHPSTHQCNFQSGVMMQSVWIKIFVIELESILQWGLVWLSEGVWGSNIWKDTPSSWGSANNCTPNMCAMHGVSNSPVQAVGSCARVSMMQLLWWGRTQYTKAFLVTSLWTSVIFAWGLPIVLPDAKPYWNAVASLACLLTSPWTWLPCCFIYVFGGHTDMCQKLFAMDIKGLMTL